MDARQSRFTYQCASSTQWVVERYGIYLINPEAGSSRFLSYPEAAIWELMTHGYSYSQMVHMLEAITALQHRHVNDLIHRSLDTWVQAGFLIAKDHHGESIHHDNL